MCKAEVFVFDLGYNFPTPLRHPLQRTPSTPVNQSPASMAHPHRDNHTQPPRHHSAFVAIKEKTVPEMERSVSVSE